MSTWWLVAACALSGCGDDSGMQPGTFRFGQIGEVRLTLSVPLLLGLGEVSQALTWSSSGPWQLVESISYRGGLGDRNERASRANPEGLAGDYAQWITQVNDLPSLQLFIDELDPELDPDCGPARTRLGLRILDESRGEEIAWVRCVEGALGNLRTSGAGPDLAAARVAAAAVLMRDRTVGESFTSSYRGSVPFATVDRGEDTPLALEGGRVIDAAEEWARFWAEHSGGDAGPPEVDFGEELVLVAAVGQRQEAGQIVEIRRVLPVGDGTVVQLFERVPGDFCSPAERLHVPYHFVLTPLVPRPVRFGDPEVERVPCGT